MTVDTTLQPYYDDFDPSKKFSQILAVPGRVEQSREFTQIQSILLNIIKKLSSAILKDGSIVSGMGFSFSGNTLTIEAGRIYLAGIVHDFDKQTIVLTKTGTEVIGVRLDITIVTENDDVSLRDPANGFANYGKEGAHRLKINPVLTKNDGTAAVIYTFVDGSVQTTQEPPQLEVINKVLARRTFDESGNYKVRGLNMWIKDYDVDNIQLTVDAGKAYIQGFEVNRPSPARVIVPKSKTIRSVSAEPKVFTTGTNQYLLNNQNAKQINAVTGTVEVTQTITRGSIAGGKDLLPNTPVVSITSVAQGGTVYSSSSDYQLSGNYVDWALAGAEPAIGSTYTVVYRYNKQMVTNTDYKLTNTGANSYLDFGLAGDKPVSSSTVTLDYDFYLARRDRVYLDANGDVKITSGQSDIAELTKEPADTDQYRLSLGTMYLPPNSALVTVSNTAISRVSMQDIYNLTKRLDNLEYNQALDDLDREAQVGESPSTLKGIFTDGFLGFSKSDLGNGLYSAAIDVSEFELLLPSTRKIFKPTVNVASSTAYKYSFNRFFMLGYTEENVSSQLESTTTMNINPYNAFTGVPYLNIVPEQDNWIDPSTINIQDQTVTTNTVWGWWNYKPDQILNLGTRTQVVDTLLPFTRQIDIEIYGEGYPADSDLLTGYIDGVQVSLTALDTTRVGTQAGTVKSNPDGSLHCKFTIPAGIRTGAREIVISNAAAKGSAVFTSQNIKRVTTNTVMTKKIVTNVIDPVAQSFQLPDDRFVTGVDLYFSSKDASIGVTVQLRSMDNGYPTAEVLAEARLAPASVNISANGTVVTAVKFDRPVLCQKNVQYCFTVMSSSANYNIHIAKIGQKSLTSTNIVTGQPYTAGVLFASSNALTWTAIQDSDLKFALKGARFNTSSTLVFNDLTTADADTLVLNIDYETPQGTTCIWEYRLDGAGNWLPIDTRNTMDLSKVANTISLRATMSTTNTYLSPVVSGENVTAVAAKTLSAGTYVSKLVTLSQAYTTVRQVIEANIPSGATVGLQLSIDNGATWVAPTLSSSQQVDSQFTQYTYTYTIPASGTSTQFRARIDVSSTNRLVKPRVRKLMNILK